MIRTNARSILTLFVRVMALWWVLGSALGFISWMTMSPGGEFSPGLIAALYFGTFLAAACLWVFADLLARAALAGPGHTTFDSDIEVSDWQRLAFACIGVWYAMEGLIDVVRQLTSTILASRAYPDMEMHFSWADVWASAFQIAVGVALLLGARGLTNAVSRLQGQEPIRSPEVPTTSGDDKPSV